MTAITHPLARTHGIVIMMITAAVLVGLTVALALVLTTAGSSSSSVARPATAGTSGAYVNGWSTRTGGNRAPGTFGTVNSGPDNPSRVRSR
jgi:hypothetical protein